MLRTKRATTNNPNTEHPANTALPSNNNTALPPHIPNNKAVAPTHPRTKATPSQAILHSSPWATVMSSAVKAMVAPHNRVHQFSALTANPSKASAVSAKQCLEASQVELQVTIWAAMLP